MNVLVIQKQSLVSISTPSVKALVKDFTIYAEISYDEVSIHFVDTDTLCQMHAQFFDDPSPTDCISFPMDTEEEEGYRILGDVFVCPETALKYVAKHGGELYHELTLYVVHGLLHLLGYDDITKKDRLAMRRAEAEYLKRVATKKLWLKGKRNERGGDYVAGARKGQQRQQRQKEG